MDKLDCALNISYDSCNSSLSNTSSVSGFEEELNELRNVINISDERVSRSKYHQYEMRIDNLNSELQTVLKQKEKYKNELFELERRNGLQYHERFEQIMRRNAQLETQLQKAHMHIEAILRANDICNGKQKVSQLENKIITLERRNYQLESNEITLKDTLLEREGVIEATRSENKALRDAVEEYKINLSIKQGCIDECKKKISEQHVNLQDLTKSLETVNYNMQMASNELEHCKKSNVWYKDQLSKMISLRAKLNKDVLENKSKELIKNNEINALNQSLNEWKSKYRDLENKVACLESKLKSETAAVAITTTTTLPKTEIVCDKDENSIKEYYESEIELLTKQISTIRQRVNEDCESFDRINKENAELQRINVITQKLLITKEAALELSEKNYKSIYEKYKNETGLLSIKNDEILILKCNLKTTTARLDAIVNDKQQFISTINNLQCVCQKFIDKYNDNVKQLHDKEKLLMEMQKSKQALFMTHNWSICELEERKNKENDYLNKIKALNDEKQRLLTANNQLLTSEKVYVTQNEINEQIIIDLKGQLSKFAETNNSQHENLLKYRNAFNYLCQKYKFPGEGEVDEFCKYIESLINNQHKIKNIILFKRKCIARLTDLENRCSLLTTKCNETEKLLVLLKQKPQGGIDEIARLSALLKVKDLEMMQKQKKYEISNRTLLRIVKEHMRRRNAAEKLLNQLQAACDGSQDELRCLKLQIKSIEHENEKLTKCIAEKEKIIVDLEGKDLQSTHMIINKALEVMEAKLKAKDERIEALQSDLRVKDNMISQLTQCLEKNNADLDHIKQELNICQEKYIQLNENHNLQIENYQKSKQVDEAKINELKKLQNELHLEHSKSINERNLLTSQVNELNNKFNCVNNENELLNSNLQQKNEELAYLKEQETILTENYKKCEELLNKKLAQLDDECKDLKENLQIAMREKFSLQRFSSDLKITLNSTLKQNEILKERLTKEREYNSLPEFSSHLSPSASLYDDAPVRDLIESSEKPQDNKPLENLHASLISLKKEMALLQKQLADKKNQVSSL